MITGNGSWRQDDVLWQNKRGALQRCSEAFPQVSCESFGLRTAGLYLHLMGRPFGGYSESLGTG